MTLIEAKRKIARIAMSDLLGCSEAPEGMPDNYPFNALKWLDVYPQEWHDELHDTIVYVYHHEKLPSE